MRKLRRNLDTLNSKRRIRHEQKFLLPRHHRQTFNVICMVACEHRIDAESEQDRRAILRNQFEKVKRFPFTSGCCDVHGCTVALSLFIKCCLLSGHACPTPSQHICWPFNLQLCCTASDTETVDCTAHHGSIVKASTVLVFANNFIQDTAEFCA